MNQRRISMRKTLFCHDKSRQDVLFIRDWSDLLMASSLPRPFCHALGHFVLPSDVLYCPMTSFNQTAITFYAMLN